MTVSFPLAAASHTSELDATKKRTAELETRLGEKNNQLEGTKEECARLSQVETELQAQVQKLTSDLAAIKTAHAADMQRLLDAREEVEGQLLKERDAAVKRCGGVDAQYQDQIRAAQAKCDLSLTCLHRVDIALAGIFTSLLLFLYPDLMLWFSDLISF